MLDLDDGMILYHGSSVIVRYPDLAKCSPYKDFGKGFYLTSSSDQAASFARIVARRAARWSGEEASVRPGFVSSYRFRLDEALDMQRYESADAEWLHCIVAHRQGKPFEQLARELEAKDVIVGKVANDQTNATILAYLAGAYGETGSASADHICISLLLPERLEDQACFRTQRALGCLQFLGSEVVCP